MSIKLVQVGLGGWGRSWARTVLPIVPDLEVAGYVEVDENSRALAQAELGVEPERFFSSLEEADQRIAYDAVLVTTPIEGHVPLGVAALNAGKHVLVEKPLALTVDAARPLADAAAQTGLVAMVSQNYRYFPAPRKTAEIIRTRALGRPHQISIEFRRNLGRRASHHFLLRQPLLVDMAIHHFDLMRMVLQDEPVELYCRTWNTPGSSYIDPPIGAAIIRFAGGTMVVYQGSWISTGRQTNWAGEWRMECDEGQIEWTSRSGGANSARRDRIFVKSTGRRAQRIQLPQQPLLGRAGSLNAFIQAIRTGETPAYATTAADNLGSIAMMEAMVASSQSGQPIQLQ
ncbi:MAG: Gfo/Idh/MocA family oxidoreductase [Caldilineaceae bacterium]|nr:Gfo/Idh/MocA family oxidoreductase [Caldilineaceae bacterium]